MALVNNGELYTSPTTQAHLRSVIDSIKRLTDTVVAAIVARLDILEADYGRNSATFNATMTVGTPVYVPAHGQAAPADADSPSTAVVVGLVVVAATSGNTGQYVTGGRVTQADWTAITGSTNLTPGAVYYLSPTTGQLTTTAPTVTGTVVRCGVALTNTVFKVEIEAGILL